MANAPIQDALERSIDELPDELRSAFAACVIIGTTPEHYARLFALTTETVEARLDKARNLLIDLVLREIGPTFGSVYQLEDSRSERITNAVLERLFSRR